MSLSDSDKAKIALKYLDGKTNTDLGKESNNEAVSREVSTSSDRVYMDGDSLVDDGGNSSAAFSVTADLVLDTTSNDHGYFAVWPTPLPNGAPSWAISGERIKKIIDPSYGTPFEVKPKAGTATIPLGDVRNWIFDYSSGVFFQALTNGSTPTTIRLFVYVGETLKDAINNVGGGSSDALVLDFKEHHVTGLHSKNKLISEVYTNKPFSKLNVFAKQSDSSGTTIVKIIGQTNPVAQTSGNLNVTSVDYEYLTLDLGSNYPAGVYYIVANSDVLINVKKIVLND